MHLRTAQLVAAAAILVLAPAAWRSVSTISADDIVLHAGAGRAAGAWRIVSDASAAGGRAAVLPNAGRAKVVTAVANPADYLELTFTAEGGTAYRLWVRGRADTNNRYNDSVHIQFSDSIDHANQPAWRIGSTSSAEVNLEDCSGCGNSGWGWEDNGWGTPTTLGPEIRFAAGGVKTLRIQNREDGFFIDQIVLSPVTYASTAPGANKDDDTILPATQTDTSVGTSAPEIILHTASATRAGGWQLVADPAAASGRAAVLPDAGRPKVTTALADPDDYFELTFTAQGNTPYRLWLRGRADGNNRYNDSLHVQFTDSINGAGAAAWRIGTTSSAEVNLEDCSGCGNSGWGWEDNGWGTPTTLGPEIRFATDGVKTIRIQNREDGFFVDQIVLSPSAYLKTAPGANKNDTTILDTGTPAPAPAPTVTLVRHPYLQQVDEASAVIVWATRESGPATARVDGRTFPAASTYFAASRTGFATDYYQHEAHVAGLRAATSYPYEVAVGDIVAAGGSAFRTAPAPGAGQIRFIAFADSGIGSTAQKSLAVRMAADAWDLALHAGDIVYGTTSTSGDATYRTYQSWFFDVYRSWLVGRPFFPAMGNHDGRASNNYGQAYLDLFVLPEHAGAGAYPDHAERYYSFDYGPVHFVALDTEKAFQDPARRVVQQNWLAADLAATPQPWKIVYLHRSPYSAGGEHGSDLAVRAAFGPIFEEHGVQLAITAHEHVYERTVPWRESSDRARQAVTYIVTGGGGARLYSAGQAAWTAYSRSSYQYLRAHVDGCVLTTAAVDASGATFDSFTLDRCAQAGDAAAPAVRLTSPAGGSTVSGVVTVAASASDDVRVEKVDLWVDGVLKAIDRSYPYAFSWDSRTVPAGAHTLEGRAYDIDGNRVSSARVTVTSTGS